MSEVKLKIIKAKEAKPSSALTFPGGQIVDMKAEGWRWSPARHAWQRKCETKGCTEQGTMYSVAWREHGVCLCSIHAKENKGILSQGKK